MIESTQELGPVSEAVITESVRITEPARAEVRRIRLSIDDPAFRFSVGQTIGVVVTGPHPMGNRLHTRRYSIASGHKVGEGDRIELELLVRRCFYVDEVSGERYPGIASNFLCDAAAGQRLTITGPYRSPFKAPVDNRSNILMIGTGTGVAPFRGFVQEIYRQRGEWLGQVRLYYGATSGLDLLYRNDADDDLANYYDEKTFAAFRALISKPLSSESDALALALQDTAQQVWDLMQESNTHVYLAGLGRVVETFDKVMEQTAMSPKAWHETRDWIRAQGRWSELIYN
jgi:ferredoxin--NADP+ reductase